MADALELPTKSELSTLYNESLNNREQELFINIIGNIADILRREAKRGNSEVTFVFSGRPAGIHYAESTGPYGLTVLDKNIIPMPKVSQSLFTKISEKLHKYGFDSVEHGVLYSLANSVGPGELQATYLTITVANKL